MQPLLTSICCSIRKARAFRDLLKYGLVMVDGRLLIGSTFKIGSACVISPYSVHAFHLEMKYAGPSYVVSRNSYIGRVELIAYRS